LNGKYVDSRNFAGTPQWNSAADSSREASTAGFDVYIDISSSIKELKQGQNILAIHGMNSSTTSTDFLISVELEAVTTKVEGEFPYPGAFDLLDGLRITELMYHSPRGSDYDYVELKNIGDTVLDLNGVRITDGVEFSFPAMELEPGGFVVVVANSAAFRAVYGSLATIAGQYTGNLSNAGEQITLRLAYPLDAAILRFEYNDGWYPTTDGGGQSLVIRDPLAHPATWDRPGSWQPANPSPGR